jgi:hypothetical protein
VLTHLWVRQRRPLDLDGDALRPDSELKSTTTICSEGDDVGQGAHALNGRAHFGEGWEEYMHLYCNKYTP